MKSLFHPELFHQITFLINQWFLAIQIRFEADK